jgi:hypothetical protein
MANVKVTVSGPNAFFSKEMDSAAVDTYVSDAYTAHYFKSDSADVYIPFDNAIIVVNQTTFTQATRDESKNFGPTP